MFRPLLSEVGIASIFTCAIDEHGCRGRKQFQVEPTRSTATLFERAANTTLYAKLSKCIPIQTIFDLFGEVGSQR